MPNILSGLKTIGKNVIKDSKQIGSTIKKQYGIEKAYVKDVIAKRAATKKATQIATRNAAHLAKVTAPSKIQGTVTPITDEARKMGKNYSKMAKGRSISLQSQKRKREATSMQANMNYGQGLANVAQRKKVGFNSKLSNFALGNILYNRYYGGLDGGKKQKELKRLKNKYQQ